LKHADDLLFRILTSEFSFLDVKKVIEGVTLDLRGDVTEEMA
jgi:hypothetical protein